MATFKHILFPVDFSPRSIAVWPFVLSVARQFNARLTMIHAMQIPTGYGSVEGCYACLSDVTAWKEDLRAELETHFQIPATEISVERIVAEGDPAGCAISFASAHGVDLIMIPTHGRGPFRRLLLGSVAAKILHDAPCAVWTSAHVEDPNLAGRDFGGNMICATDLTPGSVELIRYAVDLARQCKARLRLVHAVGGVPAGAQAYEQMDFPHFLLQSGRDGLAQLQKDAGTDLEACIAGGNVAQVVSEAARKLGADLVIVGRGRLHQTLGRLRTNTYSIVRDSPCPVLSV